MSAVEKPKSIIVGEDLNAFSKFVIKSEIVYLCGGYLEQRAKSKE